MTHPALVSGAVALVTGGASGIGFAAAERFAALGLKVCIADRGQERLSEASQRIAAAAPDGETSVLAVDCDVADADALKHLRGAVEQRFAGVDVLMANAGVSPGSSVLAPEGWGQTLGVNLMGVVNTVQAFVPGMLEAGRNGLVICTGSKQGITTPPGNPAYNISKAGVKVFAEALAHELRGRIDCRLSAHLLIPGFVFTGLTKGDRTEKPAAAWTPAQTVDFLLESLSRGDFYILCPDNDVARALDEKRIAWAAGDIVDNRPALSRWHPDFAESFKAYIEGR